MTFIALTEERASDLAARIQADMPEAQVQYVHQALGEHGETYVVTIAHVDGYTYRLLSWSQYERLRQLLDQFARRHTVVRTHTAARASKHGAFPVLMRFCTAFLCRITAHRGVMSLPTKLPAGVQRERIRSGYGTHAHALPLSGGAGPVEHSARKSRRWLHRP